jgi:hypothetical protein
MLLHVGLLYVRLLHGLLVHRRLVHGYSDTRLLVDWLHWLLLLRKRLLHLLLLHDRSLLHGRCLLRVPPCTRFCSPALKTMRLERKHIGKASWAGPVARTDISITIVCIGIGVATIHGTSISLSRVAFETDAFGGKHNRATTLAVPVPRPLVAAAAAATAAGTVIALHAFSERPTFKARVLRSKYKTAT